MGRRILKGRKYMAEVLVGAIDCSFNYCGWSMLRRNPRSNKTYIEATGIIETPKSLKAPNKSIDDIWRAKELIFEVMNIATEFKYKHADQKAFAYEVPGGSQSSRAAACLGMAKGAIAGALIELEYIGDAVLGPKDLIIPVMPNEVHVKATAKIKASKDEIIQYVVNRFQCQMSKNNNRKRPTYIITHKAGIRNPSSEYRKGQFEHIADSLVIAEIAMDKLLEQRRK